MKFLLDENISNFLYSYLKNNGVICIKGNIRGQQEIKAFNYINNNINSLIEKFIIIDKIKSGFKLKIRDL